MSDYNIKKPGNFPARILFLFICILLSSIMAVAQQTFVSANIAGLKDEQVLFVYHDGIEDRADTVKVEGGEFRWTKKMPEAQRVGIIFSGMEFNFFAESGKIAITGIADSLSSFRVSGSEVQQEAEAFRNTMKDLDEQEKSIVAQFRTASKEKIEKLRIERMAVMRAQSAREKQYVAEHPKSMLSVRIAMDWADYLDYEAASSVYVQLDKAVQQTEQGRRIANRLAVMKRSLTGEQMLDFTQNNAQGVPVNFADFRGKYVLIDFWASWCGPCRGENPNVLAAYQRYQSKNFTVIGISLDDDAANWKKAIAEDQMPWTQVSDLKGFKNEISTYYGIYSIPSTFLVDPTGKIIAKDLRGDILNQKLEEIFSK